MALRRRLRTLALGLCLITSGARAADAPVFAMIGDSTTLGLGPNGITPISIPAVLQNTFHLLPSATGLRRVQFINDGIFGSTTEQWLAPPTIEMCAMLDKRAPKLIKTACQRNLRLVDAVSASLTKPPSAALIVLGVNDVFSSGNPVTTVNNIVAIRDALAPIQTVIAPPFPATDPSRSDYVKAVRAELLRRNLITGPDWPALPTLDGLHLTEGANVQAAGIWFGRLTRGN